MWYKVWHHIYLYAAMKICGLRAQLLRFIGNFSSVPVFARRHESLLCHPYDQLYLLQQFSLYIADVSSLMRKQRFAHC